MRFVSVQIICSLLIFSYCALTAQSTSTHSRKGLDDQTALADGVKQSENADQDKKEDDESDDRSKDDDELENLPILPPIILLDFTNGTKSDEKTKRTVDGNLGYGFGKNDLFSGKYNYYFPAGKTGTTVSIESSISPFEPKTIIQRIKPNSENIKPITEKPETDVDNKNIFEQKNPGTQFRSGFGGYYQTYPVFGERTKLFKTKDHSSSPAPSTTFRPSQNYYTTVRPSSYTSSKPSYRPNLYSARLRNHESYSTIRPSEGFVTPAPQIYSTTTTTSYGSNYEDENYDQDDTKVNENSEQLESSYGGLSLSDYPKYTIENGIRYKHKIVWKYPDGKISDDPPASYTNSQFEFPSQKLVPGSSYENTGYETRPLSPQSSQGTSYDQRVNSNVYSHGPAQFPNNADSINQKPPSRFVSSASLSSGNSKSAPISQSQSYHVRYQNQFPQPQAMKSVIQNPGLYKTSTNNVHSYVPVVTQSPVSKYAMSSPSSEYTYSANSQTKGTSTVGGNSLDNTLHKYSPQVQKYLSKVFSSNPSSKSPYHSSNSETTDSTDYTNLLNYNPSISQYVKNPASILNAQPTFIQAGNSLIPVIILRVDGAPPIQPKPSPHINLKALLQQYLHQYANSVSKLTQNSNFELGSGRLENSETQRENQLNDLRLFTETLSHLSKKPAFVSAFSENHAFPPHRTQDYTRYTPITQHQNNAIHTPIKMPPKVKSVQIIEDPRYMSYKIDS